MTLASRRVRRDAGYAVIAVLSALFVVTLATGLSMHYLACLRTSHAARSRSTAAFHIAEAGLTKARWELSRPDSRYRGEKGLAFGGGTVDISVKPVRDRAAYDVVGTSTVVRGSGVSTTCTVQARLARGADGRMSLARWRQHKPLAATLTASPTD